MLSPALVSFLPLVLLLVAGAITYGLFILLPPVFAIVFAIGAPFLPALLIGAPLSSALPLLIYEAVILGVLYALKKRKSNEISKW